ncbi:beta (1-6) glucans synthase [bacterium]|nr:beta (1-6) glucans synthase [bacterium]MBU1434934.1 beta (1-6) glucans synthase [bacterium]MBU1504039.1 beta (1-6) glucans synthase [bacterium]
MNITFKKRLFIALSYFLAFIFLFGFWTLLNKGTTLAEPYEGNEKLQSASYAPFKYDESPMDLQSGFKIPQERIDEDLKLLSEHFESIRIYSVVGLEAVPKYARKHGLKLMLGIWIGADDALNQKEIQTAITLAKEYKDVISSVVVGNEVLLRRELSSTKLAGYIQQVKQALPDTKITYADVWEFWLKNPELSSQVDFVTIHILPYWEDIPVSVEDALTHVAQTRSEVGAILQNKEILIGETGWPSEGKMRGSSSATPFAQAAYMRGFLELAQQNNWNYNLIEAFDQPWKRVSEGAVGGYWGIYDKDAQDKNVFFGEVRDFKNYQTLFLLSSFVLALAMLIQLQKQILSFKLISYAFISSILLALQFNQYQIAPKDYVDYLRILTLYFAFTLLYIEALLQYCSVKFHEKWTKTALNISVFMFLIESLYLVLDGRYRSFEFYGAAFMLLSFFVLLSNKQKSVIKTPFVKFSAITIFMLAIALVFIEGIENFQALIYALLSIGFAAILFQHSRHEQIQFIYKPILFTITVSILILLWRNEFFTNAEYVLICENHANNIQCILRNFIGVLLTLKALGYASLAFALLFGIFQKSLLGYIAIFSSMAAILFFNANLGVITLVFVFMIFIIKEKKTHLQN